MPLATSRNVWFNLAGVDATLIRLPTDVYQPGHRLSLVLPKNRSAEVEVEIVKAFTPFTNSAALLVNAQTGHSMGFPNRFILKLADRRVYDGWSFEREEDYLRISRCPNDGMIKVFGQIFTETYAICSETEVITKDPTIV
ncbi:hypothetical protein C0995_002032 [Termitomyces sp. Mi166|nr:hypothetical protein C0995_002032 [Termitomyces sp. Mi166\